MASKVIGRYNEDQDFRFLYYEIAKFYEELLASELVREKFKGKISTPELSRQMVSLIEFFVRSCLVKQLESGSFH